MRCKCEGYALCRLVIRGVIPKTRAFISGLRDLACSVIHRRCRIAFECKDPKIKIFHRPNDIGLFLMTKTQCIASILVFCAFSIGSGNAKDKAAYQTTKLIEMTRAGGRWGHAGFCFVVQMDDLAYV
jgi:hypothetical protein